MSAIPNTVLTSLGLPTDGSVPDIDAAVLERIEELKGRPTAADLTSHHHPDDVAEVRRLRRELSRVEPLIDALDVPDNATNPVAAALARVAELKDDSGSTTDAYDKLWKVALYVLAAVAVVFGVILLFKTIWIGGAVCMAVAAGVVININSSKQKYEGPATLLSVGSLLVYAFILLMTMPSAPAPTGDAPRQPADQPAATKSEAEKLRDLVSGTKAGVAIDFPTPIYDMVEVKGNVVRAKKMVGVEAEYALLVAPGKAVAFKEGESNVTVDGEYLVYTSPTPVTGFRIYLDPHDRQKLPSASRPLPASK